MGQQCCTDRKPEVTTKADKDNAEDSTNGVSNSVSFPAADEKAQNEAAAKIQAIQRGKEARELVGQMKADKASASSTQPTQPTNGDEIKDPPSTDDVKTEPDDKARNDAAAKIQAIQRGNQARQEVGDLKAAKAEDAKKEADAAAAAKASEDAAKKAADDKAKDDAAAKIQALQRGNQARQQVGELKASKAEAAQSEAPAAETPAAKSTEDVDDKAKHEAATKIQALQRGNQARSEVAQLKTNETH
eukprot:TRINITY_DN58687_c0_g1_i1.p1 TRINITY_DN58687_c0_g1~~TRINITY_DN58687_c0_g1_i1.p1  ORF type:complete len:246 (-),score=74.61 TRINITY_DN58687_c0_g1_i1:144-881(-)